MPLPAFREDGWLPAGHHATTWEEVIVSFGGIPGSRRSALTRALIELRNGLIAHQVSGLLLLDGSYVSTKAEPGDFDVLLIGPSDVQMRKDTEPDLARLLDAEAAEKEGGIPSSLFPKIHLPWIYCERSGTCRKREFPKG